MERATRETVRARDGAERTIDLYVSRDPVRFSLVAELDHPVSSAELADVLAALQDRHPVLRVAVDGAHGAIPIEVAADGIPWEDVVAAEQTRPVPAAAEPPARAVIVPAGLQCAVVLTVAHRIIDDAGGPRTVLDLVTALAGEEPGPGRGPGPHQPTRGPRSGRWWTASR